MSERPARADIIIVGAGIIGMLSAWELLKRGREQGKPPHILLIDKGEPGREASWAGGGILSPLRPWHYPPEVQKLCIESQAMYPALCDELREISGVDPELIASGLLILSGQQELARGIEWAGMHDCEYRHLTPAEIHQRFPGLATEEQGLWLAAVAQVRNPRLLRALQLALKAQAVDILAGNAVRGLLLEQGRVIGVESASGPIAAETVVLACGAWTPELLPRGSWRPEIKPIKGQMLLYRAAPDLLTTMVLRGDQYLIPRQDGCIVAGSSMEDDGYNKSPTVEVKQEIRAFAESLLSPLADCPIEAHWTGLRPASPDGIPVTGPHPELDGVWLNAGHYRNGLTMAPASARALARQLLG